MSCSAGCVSLLFLVLAFTGIGATVFVNIVRDGGKTELDSLWCHVDLIRNFTEQVMKLQSDQLIAQQQLILLATSLQQVTDLLQSERAWRLPSSCADALKSGKPNGIYKLQVPESGVEPFKVYCLRDAKQAGDAWTVIQRRQDGRTDFYRGWDEYRRGFGTPEAEFFIGLDALHALTHYAKQELWVQMGDFENETRYARYASFAISDESAKFSLDELGSYEGDAGDSLRYQEGFKFSTKDHDNDEWREHCAEAYTGAWWYANQGCHHTNLNGAYLNGPYEMDKYAQGVNWYAWHGHKYSLKYVHMAIRPIPKVKE